MNEDRLMVDVALDQLKNILARLLAGMKVYGKLDLLVPLDIVVSEALDHVWRKHKVAVVGFRFLHERE